MSGDVVVYAYRDGREGRGVRHTALFLGEKDVCEVLVGPTGNTKVIALVNHNARNGAYKYKKKFDKHTVMPQTLIVSLWARYRVPTLPEHSKTKFFTQVFLVLEQNTTLTRAYLFSKWPPSKDGSLCLQSAGLIAHNPRYLPGEWGHSVNPRYVPGEWGH